MYIGNKNYMITVRKLVVKYCINMYWRIWTKLYIVPYGASLSSITSPSVPVCYCKCTSILGAISVQNCYLFHEQSECNFAYCNFPMITVFIELYIHFGVHIRWNRYANEFAAWIAQVQKFSSYTLMWIARLLHRSLAMRDSVAHSHSPK